MSNTAGVSSAPGDGDARRSRKFAGKSRADRLKSSNVPAAVAENHTHAAADSNSGPEQASPFAHTENIVIHNAAALALLAADLDELDTVEEEIDAAEGEVVVPANSGSVSVQNADLLHLMFANYTPPSPTSAAGRAGQEKKTDHRAHKHKHKHKRPSSKDRKKRPTSKDRSRPHSKERRRPSSRELPSAMIPIAGRREALEQQPLVSQSPTISSYAARHGATSTSISTDSSPVRGPASARVRGLPAIA